MKKPVPFDSRAAHSKVFLTLPHDSRYDLNLVRRQGPQDGPEDRERCDQDAVGRHDPLDHLKMARHSQRRVAVQGDLDCPLIPVGLGGMGVADVLLEEVPVHVRRSGVEERKVDALKHQSPEKGARPAECGH
jgi:hypothetical protein